MRSTEYTSLRIVRVGSVFCATRAFCNASRGNYRNYSLRPQALCKRKGRPDGMFMSLFLFGDVFETLC